MNSRALRNNLNILETQWVREPDPYLKLAFAKLYCLECCGWLEIWIDTFFMSAADQLITDNAIKASFKEDLDDMYGFTYKKHIRSILISLCGHSYLCTLESKLDPKNIEPMKAGLGNLKKWRDALAHTDLIGAQIQAPAPSVCYSEFKRAFAGLLILRRTFWRYRPSP